MNDHVLWLLELAVAPGRQGELNALIQDMVEATRANEPGTRGFEWFLSPDGSVLHILEQYADSVAVLTHVGTFMSVFSKRFLDILTPTRLTVYGRPNAEARAALDGFGASYLEPVGGFRR